MNDGKEEGTPLFAKKESFESNKENIVRKALVRGALQGFCNLNKVIREKCKIGNDNISILENGTEVTKFHSTTRWRTRKLILDIENMKIYYQHTFRRSCLKPDYIINLIDIIDIRQGWKTDTFNKIESKIAKCKRRSQENRTNKIRKVFRRLETVEEDTCFSIIFGDDKKSLDVAAESKEIAYIWVSTVKHIINVLKDLEQEEQYVRWLKKQFERADADKSGTLNFDECCKLLKQLNVKLQSQEARQVFERVNTNKNEINGEQVLDQKEFVDLFSILMSRPDIEEIFIRYSSNAQEMDATELSEFLRKEQEMDSISIGQCWNLISTFEQSDIKKNGKISLYGFTHMLLSENFEIFNPNHRVVYQDMNQPLAHYYIASSHNTYLTGGQLNGESSVEGYIQALKQGCRCVELDCWDGPSDEPIVYHGYTLTTKILLRDVLNDAIARYAFTASKYPLTLSIENHCSENQQKKMAYHLNNILKGMIYMEPVEEPMKALPSPQALKQKIIIKAKKGKESKDEEEDCEEENAMCNHNHDQELLETQKQEMSIVGSCLSDLVNICQAVSFQGFKYATERKCYHMSSFLESKAEKLIQNELVDFINYNMKHLSRIYPSGTRTESSNYKPIPFWNAGCQIVALNYQSCDKPMFINEAKFRQNGNCGYVLKPEHLRKELKDLESLNTCGKNWTLNIKIISGQYLPKPDQELDGEVIDPYVKVAILGHEEDKQKQKTKPIRNNGFNPRWDCDMEFKVRMPDLAIMIFTVKDFSSSGVNKKLGAYAIPVTSIKNGFRHIYLMDYSQKYLTPSSLFVHISLKKE